MNAANKLFSLQCAQLDHDESFHKDVVILPLGERVKHMALHNAKYTGHLFELIEKADAVRKKRIMTDAFIISLATANTLNQDLGSSLGDIGTDSKDLADAGRRLAVHLNRAGSDKYWFIREFARHNGSLSKACESLDHLEDVPFKNMMCQSNADLLRAVLAEAAALEIDLAAAHASRMREIEKRSIFSRRGDSAGPRPR
jgi:NTP pyrophosphatase (non-canonical NTP hydrolase)